MMHGLYIDEIPPRTMLSAIESFILQKKGIRVRISWPNDDRSLQLLGRAYDVASGKEVAAWDGGRSKVCSKVRGASCMCTGAMCMRHGEKDFTVKTKEEEYAQWGVDQGLWTKDPNVHTYEERARKAGKTYEQQESYAAWKKKMKEEGFRTNGHKFKHGVEDEGIKEPEQKTYQKWSYARDGKKRDPITFCAACHKEIDSCECRVDFKFHFDMGWNGPDQHGDVFSKEAIDNLMEQLRKQKFSGASFHNPGFGGTCSKCGLYHIFCTCNV